jgi:RNA polymerase sigma-70 factor (ECF subfamily)
MRGAAAAAIFSPRRLPATDESVLKALFAEHGGALLAFAMRMCGGDRQSAEDVVQETLLRAWRHPEALAAERGAVRPWLFQVARRVAIDAYRARKARPTELSDDTLESVPAADDEIDAALQSWLVADALAALSAAHRDVLVETYFRGRTVSEAAAVLGIPVGTVKSRTHYALQALRLALEERGVTT